MLPPSHPHFGIGQKLHRMRNSESHNREAGCPRLITDDLVELSSGVRLREGMVRRLSRSKSHRALAEDLEVSYMELTDAVALLRDGERYSASGDGDQ